MKNPIEARKRVMGYSELASANAACGRCTHVGFRVTGARCSKGGFFVTERAWCNDFTADPALQLLERKVQIGPTDI